MSLVGRPTVDPSLLEAVSNYTFNLDAAVAALPLLLRGLIVTVELAIIVMAIGLPLGVAVALGRLTPFPPLRWFLYAYTELFRTTPLLVQIVWLYYVPPLAFHIQTDAFEIGVLALSLNLGAYLAEAFRGAVLSIDPGQREAGLSVGMTSLDVMRRIVLPQALLRSVPLIANNWISLFKDTSLVASIGIAEMMFVARAQSEQTYRPLEILSLAAIIYFLVTFPQSIFLNRLFERFRVIEH